VAAAWFTGAGDVPRTLMAFSSDAGRTFGPAFPVDEARTMGRVDVVLLDEERALVSWLAPDGEEAAAVRLRVFTADGPAGPALTAASTSAARTSGFPRITRSGDTVYLAWTEVSADGTLQVRTARVAASALPTQHEDAG
jgi:hypothetical protein